MVSESVSEENCIGVCLGRRESLEGADGNNRNEKLCGREVGAADACQVGLIGDATLFF